jgi:hypothetical protein
MTVRPAAETPPILAIRLVDRQIVEREPASHETVPVELPVLVPVRAEPVPTVLAPLAGESDRRPNSHEGG